MRNLGPAERFAAGAIGEPGRRVFMLEIATATDHVWCVVEKSQVAAMALRSAELLQEVGATLPDPPLVVDPLQEPTDVAFRVDEVRISYDATVELIEIVLAGSEEDDALSFTVTAGQLDALARMGAAAVEGGRPRCPRCGLAMDPDGHNCPTTNGDLRNHRP